MTRLLISAIVALVLTASPALAVIKILTPLSRVLDDMPQIFVAEVEKVEPDKPGVIFKFTEDLKGKAPAQRFAVNLTGVWRCMRAELRPMLEQGSGSIVNCSSVAGVVGFAGISAYTASKHGVLGLTRTAALECAEAGVRVNAVCPGVIQTEMIDRFAHGDPATREALLLTEPVGRLGRPEEVASAVLWLCSRSCYATGSIVQIDGGLQDTNLPFKLPDL